MNILVISSFYPSQDNKKGPTSLLDYSVNSLKQNGHSIQFVKLNLPSNFILKKLTQLCLYNFKKVTAESCDLILVYPYWCLTAIYNCDLAKTLCIAPDLQSTLFYRHMLSLNGFPRFLFNIIYFSLLRSEKKIFKDILKVLFVGSSDCIDYTVKTSNTNGKYLHHPISLASSQKNAAGKIFGKNKLNKNIILFSGAAGKKYYGSFADKVLASLSMKVFGHDELIILLGSDKLGLYEKYQSYIPSLRFYSWLENYDALFEENEVILAAPLIVGSGTKNRILHAVSRNCRVITTSIGAENCNEFVMTGHIHVSNDPVEFADMLMSNLRSVPCCDNLARDLLLRRNHSFSLELERLAHSLSN